MKAYNDVFKRICSYIIIVSMIIVVFTSCQSHSSKKVSDSINTVHVIKDTTKVIVSFQALISRPEKYTGKAISVIGYLNIEFEGNALYINQKDCGLKNYRNALWLDISRGDMHKKTYQDANNKYVTIEGTFNLKNKGHLGVFSGTIDKITKVVIRQSDTVLK